MYFAYLHFTPADGSRINAVERRFALVSERVIRIRRLASQNAL